MGSFVNQRQQLLRVPLAGPKGVEWSTVLGGAQDAELAALRTAGRAHSPLRCVEDGLDDLGNLYSRSRAPRELYTEQVTGAYRARLGSAWGFWGQAPLTTGLASLFAVYAMPGVSTPAAQVISGHQGGWPGSAEVVIVWPSPLSPDDAWDATDLDGQPAVYDDGGIWDVEYTPDNPYQYGSFGLADLSWLRREIRLCKAAQAYPVVIAMGLGFDAQGASALWDDGTAWDDGGVWDDAAVAGKYTYLPLGHVWGEESMYGGGPGSWDDSSGALWDDGTSEAFAPPSGGW